MHYLETIKDAIMFFPLIAFLVTIPFILVQYHKYGSINKLRTLIIYSFILYLLTIYFLIILPLPNPHTLEYKDNMIRLIPFNSIENILCETTFRVGNPKTYLTALFDPCIYTVIFNVIMTIPFGMYLRYYFKCNLKKVVVFSFLLSLFFEVTQLTGLYFIYEYQYRVFDVDDLITNTLGGFIGYFLLGVVSTYLPTRESIDNDSFEKGKMVSGLRRITLFCLDFLIYIVLSINFWFLFEVHALIIFIIYYGVIPVLMNKNTLGSKYLNVQLEFESCSLIFGVIRSVFLYLYYLGIPYLSFYLTNNYINRFNIATRESAIMYITVGIIVTLFWLFNFLWLMIKNRIYYDKLFKLKFISTIKENLR